MRNLILIGLGLAGLAASPAQAGNSLYGVQTLASLRNCGGATAGDECPGGQRLRPFATDGGLWRATADSGYVETRSIPQRGSFGRGKGELAGDGLALPVLHAASFSAASDARVNGSALGFTSYTYTGTAPTPFSLKGTLTIDDSFASPANPLLPGGAFVSFYVGIFDADVFAANYVDFANRAINIGPFLPCDAPGVLAFGGAEPAATGGRFTVSATTQSCAGGPLMLQPGHSYVAYANLSMFTNRGGYLNALNTLTTELDPALGDAAIAELRQSLVSSVPEPGTWAMMIGGFALTGSVARRRRQGAVSA